MSEKLPTPTPTDLETRVLAAIDDEETIELLRDLIRCPSENPPGNEEATASCLAAFFDRNGVSHRLEEVVPGRPNLIAEIGSSGGPTLVLNGHIDTVPAGAGWTFEPFGAEMRDGRVYGRGASDMLAGVAAMSVAVVALKRSGVALDGRLLIHAVIDEELHSIGSKHAARDVEADWVIVTEPSSGKIDVCGKGQLNVEIVFHGKAAHSSTPELGHNAIHDAAAFTALVEREHIDASAYPHPDAGPVTYAVAIINGGTNGSIIPAECKLTLDRRLLPTETLEEAEADIQRLLDELAQDRPGLDVTVRPTLLFPPFSPAENNELAQTIAAARHKLDGGETEFSGMRGTGDATWYAARGIPTVFYGPGNAETAHQPDEFVDIDDVNHVARTLTLTCVRLLARSPQ
jgi:acetylornithine deacetylase/succinyl-diaminopimelate desuccinylase family protein